MSASDAVRAFEDAFEANDADTMKATATDDYVDHTVPEGIPSDIEGAVLFRGMIASAFPNMKQMIDEVIEQGDTAASRWHAVATHEGEWFGVAATGKQVEVAGMSFYKIRDGKVAEIWNLFDQAGLMEQISG